MGQGDNRLRRKRTDTKDRSSRQLFFSQPEARFRETFGVLPALLCRSRRRDEKARAGQEMSRLITGISGVIALTVISCAAQLALGRDLAAPRHAPINQPLPPSFISLDAGTFAVNRGAKADRAPGSAGSPALMRTVSVRLDGFSTTTFLLRVPSAGGSPVSATPPAKSGVRRPMIACEPVVSVLTEVARQLQPGRCVT
jgi:hypothetical protein